MISQHEMTMDELHPQAIVWDLDGTLVESAPDLATALNALLNENGRHGHHVRKVRPMIGGGVGKLIERGFEASGVTLSKRRIDALVPRFMTLYTAVATRRTHLVPHAREVLQHFYDSGIRQGLCTNKPREVTMQILHALDIAGFFGSVVGGDSTSEKKPHPLPLQTCLSELQVEPANAVLVGDTSADVGAAHAAGVPVILVPDGYTGAPAVSLGADYVVGSLADVPASFRPQPTMRRTA
ncbi:MAG: phosphoglycolate phosphatase [Lysobacterales bacterium]